MLDYRRVASSTVFNQDLFQKSYHIKIHSLPLWRLIYLRNLENTAIFFLQLACTAKGMDRKTRAKKETIGFPCQLCCCSSDLMTISGARSRVQAVAPRNRYPQWSIPTDPSGALCHQRIAKLECQKIIRNITLWYSYYESYTITWNNIVYALHGEL